MQTHARIVLAAFAMMALAVPHGVAAEVLQRLPGEEPVGVIDDTQTSLPQVQEANGISFISGGVGSAEADALNRMSDRFNLKLTMSIPTGQFTSPSALRIQDAGGQTLLETRPKGPIFLAKMPAGDYVIQVTSEGQTLTRKATVPASGLEAIALTWPAADQPKRAGDAPEG